MNNGSMLTKVVSQCKFPLKISFVFDVGEGVYLLSVGYENVFPATKRFEEIPEDLEKSILEVLEDFDISSNNQKLIEVKLKSKDSRTVKPIKDISKSKIKRPKKTKFAKQIL